MYNEKAFLRLSAMVPPDRGKLDDEFVALPGALLEVAENMAGAYTAREMEEYTYKCAMSDAANEMRAVADGGKKPSETQITQDLPTYPKVYEAFLKVCAAREDYAKWSGLHGALEIKKVSLNKLGDFTLAGFMSHNAGSHQAGRAALAEARGAAPAPGRAKLAP